MNGYPVVQMLSEERWKPETVRSFYAFAAIVGCETRPGGVLVKNRRQDDNLSAWWASREPVRSEMMKAQVARAVAGLTPRARKLWEHVKDPSKFYRWDGPDSGPKTMRELEKAGLVTSMGRVVSIHRCWVPAGAAPFEAERFPSW
jgi:hypothetical protein